MSLFRRFAGHVVSHRAAHFRSALAARRRRRRLTLHPVQSRVIIALTSRPHVLMTSTRGRCPWARPTKATARWRQDPPVLVADGRGGGRRLQAEISSPATAGLVVDGITNRLSFSPSQARNSLTL